MYLLLYHSHAGKNVTSKALGCQGPPIALEYGTSGKAFERNVRELAYNEGLGVRSLPGRQMWGRGHR